MFCTLTDTRIRRFSLAKPVATAVSTGSTSGAHGVKEGLA